MLFSAWNEARKSYVNFSKLSSMNKPGHQKILIQLTCFYGKMTVGNRKITCTFCQFYSKGSVCYLLHNLINLPFDVSFITYSASRLKGYYALRFVWILRLFGVFEISNKKFSFSLEPLSLYHYLFHSFFFRNVRVELAWFLRLKSNTHPFTYSIAIIYFMCMKA